MNVQISERDLISMKLLHYFITKKNYSPIIVQGVENEIWIQNLDADKYKVIRIVNGYIHNDEQLEFDVFKTKRMVKKIRKKTFSLKMKTLNILTDVGENVDREKKFDDVDIIYYTDEDNLLKNEIIKSEFKDLKDNLTYTEEGFNLFFKITQDINMKNNKENMEAEKILEPKKPIVTFIIIGILVLMFFMQFIFTPIELLYYLGVQKDLVRYGEIYRLLTGAFLHLDILHLLCNLYALYVVGKLSESYFGKWKFTLIYLFSALTGSLLSISMGDNFSIGASGAIFGLLGSLLYFGYHYRVYFGNVLLKQIVPVIIFNLAIGFMIDDIDNFAHIGGLIGGLLISKAVGINSKDKKSDKINGIILSVIYLAFLIFLAFFMER